jgi:hypothetical protein
VIREMGVTSLLVYLNIEARMYHGSVCAWALVASGPIQACDLFHEASTIRRHCRIPELGALQDTHTSHDS